MARQRKLIPVACVLCGVSWQKREDSLAEWRGLCRSCASWKKSGMKSSDDVVAAERERTAAWGRANPEKRKAHQKRWLASRPGYTRWLSARHRKGVQQATPPWADEDEIRRIYEECPAGYEVDHIIPLRHPRVSGLHVPENLQYLRVSANRRKHRKFEGSIT